MAVSSFSVQAMIRGYHVYRTATINEELGCQREIVADNKEEKNSKENKGAMDEKPPASKQNEHPPAKKNRLDKSDDKCDVIVC